MKAINPDGSRVDLSPDDSLRSVLTLVQDPNLNVLQFNRMLPMALLEGLNSEFFTQRPNVELRAYGFDGDSCDLSFCARMSNIERFRADCLQQAEGVEAISNMSRLTSLGVGIWSLDSFDILKDVNPRITALFLSPTKSKKPDLSPVARFKNLETLYLDSHQKNIEALSDLHALQNLTLRSITLDSLDAIASLPRLRSLDLKLGGTSDLSAISGMRTLTYLELWRILGLTNIEVISSLTGLETLVLENLTHITSLPSLTDLKNLRTIFLGEMKALTDISALAGAPALEKLSQVGSRLPIESYLPLLQKGMLKTANVGFGSLKKNGKFREHCVRYGVNYDVAYK